MRRFGRGLRRVVVLVVVGFVVLAVVRSGARAVVSMGVGWLVFGYLLWRAWPGVRSDLGRVRVRSPFWRRRSSGGVF